MPKLRIKPANADPYCFIDLFDAERKNESGEMHCIASAILPGEAAEYWKRYLSEKSKEQNESNLHQM